jgi:hypothetical protein
MYYLDLHEEGRESSAEAQARTCALVHNVVGTARIAVTPGPLDLRLVNTLLPNSCFVKKKFAAITVFQGKECNCEIGFASPDSRGTGAAVRADVHDSAVWERKVRADGLPRLCVVHPRNLRRTGPAAAAHARRALFGIFCFFVILQDWR